VGFRQSCGGGGELHGSFVGSPRRSRGFRRLRMTRGMERWADGCRPYGTWFHLFGASPRLTPWALSCRPFGAGVWWFRLRLLLEILFLRDEGGVVFRRRRWWWRLVAWVVRWESPAEPRTPLPQDDKVPRGVLGRRRWFAASSAFWLPGRKFGVPCRNGWGGGVWLD
jgi:hypothetical protein